MDVYDLSQQPLQAAHLDHVSNRLSGLGHATFWISLDQSLVALRQRNPFLLPRGSSAVASRAGSAAAGELALRISAGFAALIYGVHPLRVEPVAWASGRENVVSGPLFVLTLICYLRAVQAGAIASSYWKWMVAAWFSYALSLLGKGAGVTLPMALLVLDIYPLKRLGGNPAKWLQFEARRVWLEKAPFLLLALVAGLLAIFGKQQSKLMYGFDQYGLAERGVQTVYGLIFYLWKTLLPLDLSPLYEMERLALFEWRFILSAVVLVAITALLFASRRRWPWALACWVFYGVILLPYAGVLRTGRGSPPIVTLTWRAWDGRS